MPIIVSGGGGGGIAGYKYPPGNVKDIEIVKTGNNYYLTWTDPDNVLVDDKYLSEWKGTIVVRNDDHEPVGPEDGDLVVNSTIKNQYKENGLDLGSNGDGYFYGVFPYTKNFVFNVSSSNIIYYPTGGFEGSLENATWNDVIYAVDKGIAQDLWNEGDRIGLKLQGDYYNFDVHMKIVGFNHDDLVGGGKANITFMLDDIFVENSNNLVSNSGYGNANANCFYSAIYLNVFPKILSCMPVKLVQSLKEVYKYRFNTYYGNTTDFRIIREPRNIFGFSVYELDLGEFPVASKNEEGYGVYEGTKYEYFVENGNEGRIIKNIVSGNASKWWTDTSSKTYGEQPFSHVNSVNTDGSKVGINYSNGATEESYAGKSKGVVFGFCI